jgi:hypothetical protein
MNIFITVFHMLYILHLNASEDCGIPETKFATVILGYLKLML